MVEAVPDNHAAFIWSVADLLRFPWEVTVETAERLAATKQWAKLSGEEQHKYIPPRPLAEIDAEIKALEAARRLAEFIAGKSWDDYLPDSMLSSAVERQFEIVGEALNQLRSSSPEVAEGVPDFDWMFSRLAV